MRHTGAGARALLGQSGKAYAHDSARVFAKRSAEVDGELRIAADPPVIVPIEDLIVPGSEWEDPSPLIKKLLASYRRTLGHQGHPLEEFRYVHAARKVVGVGSVGTRCYICCETRDMHGMILDNTEGRHAQGPGRSGGGQ
jgi:hypothetical protein